MVSGWWLLASFWIGGCLGIMLAMLLQLARDDDDGAKEALLQRREPALADRRAPER
jgi:hypothetical protein